MNAITMGGLETLNPALLACGGYYIANLPEISVICALGGLITLAANLVYPRLPRPLPANIRPNTLGSRSLGLMALAVAAFAPLWVVIMLVARVEVGGLGGLVGLAAGPLLGLLAVRRAHKARKEIARSNGALAGREIAGTGLITGYAAIFLCLFFVGTAKANYRYRPCGSACINNLRQIDGAKEQWALENKKTQTDAPAWNDLVGSDKYIKVQPVCPSNGTYTIGNMTTKPLCSTASHTL